MIFLSCACLLKELKPLQRFSLSSTENIFELESIHAELLSEFKNAVFKKCPLPQSDLKIFLKPAHAPEKLWLLSRLTESARDPDPVYDIISAPKGQFFCSRPRWSTSA